MLLLWLIATAGEIAAPSVLRRSDHRWSKQFHHHQQYPHRLFSVFLLPKLSAELAFLCPCLWGDEASVWGIRERGYRRKQDTGRPLPSSQLM